METVVINQIKDQSYTMKESLRALKTSISFSGKGVKSILFTSSVPNEGKTTVVMDLARSMADSKKSVLVVDTDMRKSVLVGRGNVRSARSFSTGSSENENTLPSIDSNVFMR